MLNRKIIKEDKYSITISYHLYHKAIKDRKIEIGYIQPSKNKTHRHCEECLNFNAFSPSLNRCDLIGLAIDEKICSINLFGICDYYNKQNAFKCISYLGEDNE